MINSIGSYYDPTGVEAIGQTSTVTNEELISHLKKQLEDSGLLNSSFPIAVKTLLTDKIVDAAIKHGVDFGEDRNIYFVASQQIDCIKNEMGATGKLALELKLDLLKAQMALANNWHQKYPTDTTLPDGKSGAALKVELLIERSKTVAQITLEINNQLSELGKQVAQIYKDSKDGLSTTQKNALAELNEQRLKLEHAFSDMMNKETLPSTIDDTLSRALSRNEII